MTKNCVKKTLKMPAKKYLKNDQNHFFLCFISCLPIYLSTYLQIISNILNIIKVEELSPPSLFQKACTYVWLFEFILFSFYESRFYCGVKICTTIVNAEWPKRLWPAVTHNKRACRVLQKNARFFLRRGCA